MLSILLLGFMFGTNVLDKDGISAAVVMAEMASYLNRHGLTLTEQLHNLYKRYGVHVSNNSYYLCHSPLTIKKIFDRIRTLDNGQYPSTCGPYKLSGIRDLTAGYDSTKPDNKPVSTSQPCCSSSFSIITINDMECMQKR
ncbi:glucose 1,6-bisphosphate synthase-like [Oculina patagonica]